MATANEMVEILSVERYSGYGLVVSFSDGTSCRYQVEELLRMRPEREQSAGVVENLFRFATLMRHAKVDARQPGAGQGADVF